jgi:hypothetical protein
MTNDQFADIGSSLLAISSDDENEQSTLTAEDQRSPSDPGNIISLRRSDPVGLRDDLARF